MYNFKSEIQMICDYVKGGAKSLMPLRLLILALAAPVVVVGFLIIFAFAAMVALEQEASNRILPHESVDLWKFAEGLFILLLLCGVMSYISFMIAFRL